MMSLARIYRDGQQDLVEADWAEVSITDGLQSEILTFWRTIPVVMSTATPEPTATEEIVAQYRWDAIQGYVWQEDPEELQPAPAPELGAEDEEKSG